MSLRLQAEADLAAILENDTCGFGWPIVLVDPSQVETPFIGYSNDIAQVIDPDTGQAVSGRLATVTLRISSIYAAGLPLPFGVVDGSIKPWLVKFEDINGLPYTFKVSESDPDRALGVIVLILETYAE